MKRYLSEPHSQSVSARILLVDDHPVVRAGMAEGQGSWKKDALDCLSDRELEVFREIGKVLGTRKISEKLCLSIKTVETHIAHIKRKLKLQSAVELQHRAFHWTKIVVPG